MFESAWTRNVARPRPVRDRVRHARVPRLARVDARLEGANARRLATRQCVDLVRDPDRDRATRRPRSAIASVPSAHPSRNRNPSQSQDRDHDQGRDRDPDRPARDRVRPRPSRDPDRTRRMLRPTLARTRTASLMESRTK